MVSWSRQVQICEQACAQLAEQGIAVELIDLRSIWPWDRDAVLQSCARTGHLLVVHEAIQAAGFGAEIAATAAEAHRLHGAPARRAAHSGRLRAGARGAVARRCRRRGRRGARFLQ